MRELGTAITINPDDRAPQIVFITQHLSKQRSQILGIIFSGSPTPTILWASNMRAWECQVVHVLGVSLG